MPGIQDLILNSAGAGQSNRVIQSRPGVITPSNLPSKAGGAISALMQILTSLDKRAKMGQQSQQLQNLSRVLSGGQPQPIQNTGASGAVNNFINRIIGGGTKPNPVISQGTTGFGLPGGGGSQGAGSSQQLVQQLLATGAGSGNMNMIKTAVGIGQVLNQAQSATNAGRTKAGTAKSFVDSKGNFVGSFVPGQEPQGSIPLDVHKSQQAQGVKATRPLDDDFAELMTSGDPKKERIGELMLKYKRALPDEKAEAELFKTVVKELPPLKTQAFKASKGIDRINRMLELVDTGNVTGKGGQIKAGLAGWAEVIGVSKEKLKGMSEAQLFQRLGRLIVGPMRLEIIGPGPVTDFEQGILDRMAGAGGMTASAARELLNHYIDLANENIELYNITVEGAAELHPRISKAFKRIEVKQGRGRVRKEVATRREVLIKLREQRIREQGGQ